MIGPRLEAFQQQLARAFEEDETQRGVPATQLIPITALQGRAGQYQTAPVATRLLDQLGQTGQPAVAIVVIQRDAARHLGHVGLTVIIVAIDELRA